MSLPLFKDFDKSVQDIFKDDYDTKCALKVKTSAPYGVSVTNATECSGGKTCGLGGKLTFKYNHESGFQLDKLEVKQDGGYVVESSLSNLAPGLKLEFKGDSSNKADIGVVYKSEVATVAADLDLAEFSKANVSVLGGTGPLTAGASVGLKLADKFDVKSFEVAAGYKVIEGLFGGLKVTDKFTTYALSASYVVSPKFTLAGLFRFKPEDSSKSAEVGGVFKWCPNFTLKTKFSTAGIVGVSAKNVIDKTCTVIGAAEVPVSDFAKYKVGVNVTLG